MIDNELELLKGRYDELLQKLTHKQNEEDTKKRIEAQKASLRASIKMLEEKLRGETPATKSMTQKTTSPAQINTTQKTTSPTQANIDTPPTQATQDTKQTENEPDAITGNGMFFSFKIDESSSTADMEKHIRKEIFKKIERGEI